MNKQIMSVISETDKYPKSNNVSYDRNLHGYIKCNNCGNICKKFKMSTLNYDMNKHYIEHGYTIKCNIENENDIIINICDCTKEERLLKNKKPLIIPTYGYE